MEVPAGAGLTAQQVKNVLIGYVKEKGLKSECGGLVRLDELLSELVLARGDNGCKEVKWEQLQQFTLNKMSPGYSLKVKYRSLVMKLR